MRIGFSTGYTENYWGDWFRSKQTGGSERIVVELACALVDQGHEVTVRLPYREFSQVRRGVRWVGIEHQTLSHDLLFAFDDFAVGDKADRTVLVACRSDPPPHTHFDQMIFLSAHHATLMGHFGRPHVGGGVNLADYGRPADRIPRRVICTSSPDRCSAAVAIGRGFDFVHSYRPVPGFQTTEFSREDLIQLQQTAQVLIYPLAPSRPSDFFSMAVLESMAAGTPVVVSDADSMPELWFDAAIILPRPIRLSQWHQTVEELLEDRSRWLRHSSLGLELAKDFTWDKQATRYLEAALA